MAVFTVIYIGNLTIVRCIIMRLNCISLNIRYCGATCKFHIFDLSMESVGDSLYSVFSEVKVCNIFLFSGPFVFG